MRRLVVATASAAAILASFASISPAAAEGRYCLQGRQWGYPGNCQFATYQQCRASASGTNADCGINPSYAFAQQRRGNSPGYGSYPSPYPRY